ncbi:patatin-like phospholipase family protein [Actinopolymorpha sp. B9G3]|uniref:patatin-like phospholipase family protein n=1 Tax=Actinopolymorpha sp. B9G3 TaxID=3158970 RepID=UPI0032D95915
MGGKYWTPDHPVLRVLDARRSRKDRPGRREDPHKVGLAIQGGGMRGVISGAMLTALDDLGLHDTFDAIYGSSSGALNGAYSYAGDSWRQLPIYWDDLTTGHFIDLRRGFSGNIVDLDYAFDEVVGKLRPLDADAVLRSEIPLHVAISLVDEIRTHTVSSFSSAEDLRLALRASAWLPVAVRGTAEFHGQRAIDGAILTTHPVRLAEDDGCTHILSLSTRPLGPGRVTPSLVQLVSGWHLDRIRPGLSKAYHLAIRGYQRDRARLSVASRTANGPPHILDIAPLPDALPIRPLEQDPGRLILAARSAYELAHCVLDHGDVDALRAGAFRTVPRFTRVNRGERS